MQVFKPIFQESAEKGRRPTHFSKCQCGPEHSGVVPETHQRSLTSSVFTEPWQSGVAAKVCKKQNVKLQENYDLPHGVTKLTKHPDLLTRARRDPLRQVDKRGPTPGKCVLMQASKRLLKKDNAS